MRMQKSSEVLSWKPLVQWLRETGRADALGAYDSRVNDHLISSDGMYIIARKNLADPASVWVVYEARTQRVLGHAGTRPGAIQEAEIIEVGRRISAAVGRARGLLRVLYARSLRRAAGIYLAARTIRRARSHAHQTRRPG